MYMSRKKGVLMSNERNKGTWIFKMKIIIALDLRPSKDRDSQSAFDLWLVSHIT